MLLDRLPQGLVVASLRCQIFIMVIPVGAAGEEEGGKRKEEGE
jgi:hypothetical protein